MAAEQTSDILIKFIVNGSPIDGESTTALDVGTGRNELLMGFMAEKMFELESFTFSVGVDDDSSEAGGKAGAAATSIKPGAQRASARSMAGDLHTTSARPISKPVTAPLGGYKAFRTGRKAKPYPVNVSPISFTRGIDRASTSLLTHCIACTTFDYVALVKRKPAGGAAAGEPYLRMDFVGALIIDVAWNNEDPIKETCKFISRAITVRYRPQLPSGRLGAPRVGFWSMLPWETEAPLR